MFLFNIFIYIIFFFREKIFGKNSEYFKAFFVVNAAHALGKNKEGN